MYNEDDNVIRGAFGRLGQTPAGEMMPVTTPEDLQKRLNGYVKDLKDLARATMDPSLAPAKAVELTNRLAELQERLHGVAEKLKETITSEDGYMSMQEDLNSLGAEIAGFRSSVEQAVPQMSIMPIEEEAVVPAVRHRAFPWGWTFFGFAAVGGLIWLLRNGRAGRTAGLGSLKDARAAR